ncbi:MAG: low molecular weight phosphotyrosine protein phosphatase [Rubrivivax sp.]|nr:low molecular weight phosphotyrosine protein phosphatase [Rubrivivax sp.]MBK7263052.1 low molecular weight phosphotyrosine protein phosphatase [Rubrivivax sp.]MBK8527021.1 low molecular weight phosphotyrosine protein phosphatase [Rubrivivax sp.]
MKRAILRLLGRHTEPDLRVLMVCSGNICRSPTAEAVLRFKLVRAGLGERVEVDSAGTHGFHVKEAPDPRAQDRARARGYDLSGLRARGVVADDFRCFQHILAMDDGHLKWLNDAAPPDCGARIGLLMAHAGQGGGRREVPDPYYGSTRDFERVLDLVEVACDGLVHALGRELIGRDRNRPAQS